MSESSKKALIVVDIQNDFCPGGSLAVKDGDQVIAPLNRMISFASKNDVPIKASRDYHPEITNHFDKWPPHCIKGTPGAKFHPGIDHAIWLNACVFSKGIEPNEDAYSAFDGRNEWGDSLQESLIEDDVDEIWVGGLATDYCVKATCLNARGLGFQVILLKDACRAVNLKPGDEERAIEEMCNAGVIISTTEEVINAS